MESTADQIQNQTQAYQEATHENDVKAGKLRLRDEQEVLDLVMELFPGAVLQKYGNGAIDLLYRNENIETRVLFPADDWRRNGGGQISWNEVYIIENNLNTAEAEVYAQDAIDDILTHPEGRSSYDSYGAEIETHVVDSSDLSMPFMAPPKEFEPGMRIELGDMQRELALPPAFGLDQTIETYRGGFRKLLEKANSAGHIVSFNSTFPGISDFNHMQFNDHSYVLWMVDVLKHKKGLGGAVTLNGAFGSALKQMFSEIAGNEVNIVDIVESFGIVFWQLNAAHGSNATLKDANGRTFDHFKHNMLNVSNYFGDQLNVPNYSGGYYMGRPFEIDGVVTHDGREHVRYALSSARPGATAQITENSLVNLQAKTIIESLANHPGRMGGEIIMNNGNADVSTHGGGRSRDNISLAQYLEDRLQGVKEKRFELTDRPGSPHFEKTIQSLCMQKVLHYANLLSTADGYRDLSAWIADQGIDMSDYYQHTTKTAMEARERSVVGKYENDRIEKFGMIIEAVERRFEERGNELVQNGETVTFNFDTFAHAYAVVNSMIISQTNTLEERYEMLGVDHRSSGPDKYGVFLDKPGYFANYGEFIMNLTKKEIEDILIESKYFERYYSEEDIRAGHIGNLHVLMSHMTADFTSR